MTTSAQSAGPEGAEFDAVRATAGTRIDRRIYTDPEVFALEQKRLFGRAWQYVAHESELARPGDYRARLVAGKPIIVTRTKDGSLSAFYNSCTHRGALLAPTERGSAGNSFKCMYHGWSFDLVGKCVGIPYAESYGEDFDRATFDIPQVRVDAHAGMVFVALDPLVPTLTEFLGEIGDFLVKDFTGMEVIGRIRNVYRGNWKQWHENFSDGYHPLFTHRWIRELTQPKQGVGRHISEGHSFLDWGFGAPAFDRYNTGLAATTGLETQSQRNPEHGFPPIQPGDWNRIYAIFPTMDVQIAALVTPEIEVLHPIAPDRTIVEAVFFGEIGESAEKRQWRLARSGGTQSSSGKVAADDNEAIERCWTGIGADAVPYNDMARGPVGAQDGLAIEDHGVRGFYDAWRRYLLTD
ncbi:aromatic ring-hydroxylating dioxygenase subunit alpha [Streptomyces sp. NPDC091281]|uniref:aromatic ring-hydroxylating oxygenase subunit alpha n=1 Tax=Streptomyces sp. NPDC091281 TaxID=3365985 RepID=UPI00380D457E